MKRFFKIFFMVYVGSALFVAAPFLTITVAILWAYGERRARKAKALYQMMTAPPRSGSERWDRTITKAAP